MNKTQFISLLKSPEKTNGETSALLEGLLKEFPYCQTAHLLYAKTLHSENSIHYQQRLKTASVYASDRKVLYHLIMQPGLTKKIEAVEKTVDATVEEQKSLPAKEATTQVETSVKDISFIEKEILKEAISASLSRELQQTPIVPKKETKPTNRPREEKAEKTTIDIRKEGRYSFSDWLEILSGRAIPEDKKSGSAELIDKFLRQESPPSETKTEFFSPSAMARLSLVEDERFVTETLAKIYAKQEDFERAINAYKNLILKFPEKSTYFAARIKELEKQISDK